MNRSWPENGAVRSTWLGPDGEIEYLLASGNSVAGDSLYTTLNRTLATEIAAIPG